MIGFPGIPGLDNIVKSFVSQAIDIAAPLYTAITAAGRCLSGRPRTAARASRPTESFHRR